MFTYLLVKGTALKIRVLCFVLINFAVSQDVRPAEWTCLSKTIGLGLAVGVMQVTDSP